MRIEHFRTLKMSGYLHSYNRGIRAVGHLIYTDIDPWGTYELAKNFINNRQFAEAAFWIGCADTANNCALCICKQDCINKGPKVTQCPCWHHDYNN